MCPGEARLLQRHISLLQWQCLDVAAFAFGATHSNVTEIQDDPFPIPTCYGP